MAGGRGGNSLGTRLQIVMMTLIQHMKRVKVWAIALSAAVALAFVAAAPAHVRQTGSSTSPSHSAPSHHRKSSGRHRRSSRMHLPAAPTRDRISEIQSALARGGYYKGDPNGKWDSDTARGDAEIPVGERPRFHRQTRRADVAEAGSRLGHRGSFGAQAGCTQVLRDTLNVDGPSRRGKARAFGTDSGAG